MKYARPRGTQDILPPDVYVWRYVEDVFERVLAQFGYEPIRTPIFETTDLFLRSVGEATLVVELRDSRSNATLARILDRRSAGRSSGPLTSTTAASTADVERLASHWALRFRQRLDEAPSLAEIAAD